MRQTSCKGKKLNKKEIHIITVGNSLIVNYQKNTKKKFIKNLPMGDKRWSQLLQDPSFLSEIFAFLRNSSMENSAELNSFLRYTREHKINPQECEIYLAGTKTASNEIVLRTLEKYFKTYGYQIYEPPQFPGYLNAPVEIAVPEFVKGLSSMLDRFIYIATKKKNEGYEVLFNPTGGFKAHVIICALAGFLIGCKVYYIHEEFKDVIVFPPLFYLPREGETSLLGRFFDKVPWSGEEIKKLIQKYPEQMDRLSYYGLIEIERDEFGEIYRGKITEKGRWAYNYLKELRKKE